MSDIYENVKFCIGEDGKYLGAHIGDPPANTFAQVATRPGDDRDVWDFDAQVWIPAGPTIAEQISALEAQQTPRRIRDALFGNQESIDFLQDIEDQIELLRK